MHMIHLWSAGAERMEKKMETTGLLSIKGIMFFPKNREPQEYNWNIRTLGGILLLYSYYVLGVPCFGVPLKVPFIRIRA